MKNLRIIPYLIAISFLAVTTGSAFTVVSLITGDTPNLHDINRDRVQYNQNQQRSYNRPNSSTYFQQGGNYYYQKPADVNRNINGPSGMRFDQNGQVQYDYR